MKLNDVHFASGTVTYFLDKSYPEINFKSHYFVNEEN